MEQNIVMINNGVACPIITELRLIPIHQQVKLLRQHIMMYRITTATTFVKIPMLPYVTDDAISTVRRELDEQGLLHNYDGKNLYVASKNEI